MNIKNRNSVSSQGAEIRKRVIAAEDLLNQKLFKYLGTFQEIESLKKANLQLKEALELEDLETATILKLKAEILTIKAVKD